MESVDPQAKKLLDLRLAKGDIGTDEYERLLHILSGRQQAEPYAKDGLSSQEAPVGELLLQFQDLYIYSSHIVIAGRRKEFSDLLDVDGGSSVFRINLVPATKRTYLRITFKNGDSYYEDEERTLFGRERHRKIAQAVHLLKQLTFRSCFNSLVEDVRTNHLVRIGIEEEIPFVGIVGTVANAASSWKPAPIALHREGTITNGKLTIDLKQCRREGILELGIYRGNLSQPENVYACNEKSILFEKSHGKALRFRAGGTHRADAIFSLLDWMAAPESKL